MEKKSRCMLMRGTCEGGGASELGEPREVRMDFINSDRKHTCCPALSPSAWACLCVNVCVRLCVMTDAAPCCFPVED